MTNTNINTYTLNTNTTTTLTTNNHSQPSTTTTTTLILCSLSAQLPRFALLHSVPSLHSKSPEQIFVDQNLASYFCYQN